MTECVCESTYKAAANLACLQWQLGAGISVFKVAYKAAHHAGGKELAAAIVHSHTQACLSIHEERRREEKKEIEEGMRERFNHIALIRVLLLSTCADSTAGNVST